MSGTLAQSQIYKLCGIDHRVWGCTRPANDGRGGSGCPEKSSEDVQRLYQKLIPKGATIETKRDDNGWTLEWKRGLASGSLRLDL